MQIFEILHLFLNCFIALTYWAFLFYSNQSGPERKIFLQDVKWIWKYHSKAKTLQKMSVRKLINLNVPCRRGLFQIPFSSQRFKLTYSIIWNQVELLLKKS
jgi:hypothetical protein